MAVETPRSPYFDLPVQVTDDGGVIGGGGGEPNDPYRAPSWKNTLSGTAADGPPCLKTAKELEEPPRPPQLDHSVQVTDDGGVIGGGGGEPNDPYRAPSWKNTLSGTAADGPPCLKMAKELDEEIYHSKLALKDKKKKTAAAHEHLKNAKSSTQYYMSHVVGGDGGHEENELVLQGHKEAEGKHYDEHQRLQSIRDKQLHWEETHWFSYTLVIGGLISPDEGAATDRMSAVIEQAAAERERVALKERKAKGNVDQTPPPPPHEEEPPNPAEEPHKEELQLGEPVPDWYLSPVARSRRSCFEAVGAPSPPQASGATGNANDSLAATQASAASVVVAPNFSIEGLDGAALEALIKVATAEKARMVAREFRFGPCTVSGMRIEESAVAAAPAEAAPMEAPTEPAPPIAPAMADNSSLRAIDVVFDDDDDNRHPEEEIEGRVSMASVSM